MRDFRRFEVLMFLVKDTIESREATIRRFLSEGEPSIALLLAVVDLERTLRRTILALGSTPTKELGLQLGKRPANNDLRKGPIGYRSGLNGLHDAWKSEVQLRIGRKLPGDLSRNWSDVLKACRLRNDLVHGSRGPTSKEFAQSKINAVLSLTRALQQLSSDQGQNLNEPVRRRIKERRCE